MLLFRRIAVHIRYGDYRTNRISRAFHGLTHPSYYIDGINRSLANGEVSSLLILSDEPQLAFRELQAEGINMDLDINFGNSNNQFEDLALMASSTSIIASNSSFSWWGSWIAKQRSEAFVCMPTPWFSGKEISEPSLYFNGTNVLYREIIL